jgi:Mg2+ and Co2+ transporter CorA
MSTQYTQATMDLLSCLRRGETVTPEAWLQSFISSPEELERLDAQIDALDAQREEKTNELDRSNAQPFVERHKALLQTEAEAYAREATKAREYLRAVTTLFKGLALAGHQESATILCSEVAQARRGIIAVRAQRERPPKVPTELIRSKTEELTEVVRALDSEAQQLEKRLTVMRTQSMLAAAALKRLASPAASAEMDVVVTAQHSLPAPTASSPPRLRASWTVMPSAADPEWRG